MQSSHLISRSLTLGFTAAAALATLYMALAPAPSLFAG